LRLPLVLLYHIVAPCPVDADREERGLFVEPMSFEEQMNDLATRGFRTLTLDQFAAAMSTPAPPKSFVVTFDDAYAHIDPVVSPVLRAHGFSAVMFACPAHLGCKNTWDGDHSNLSKLDIATRMQLKDMADGPWEIASHGQRHVDLRGLGPEQRRTDLREARAQLSEIAGKPVVDLAYPYGFDDPTVRADVLAAGYRMAFTAWHASGADRLHLRRRPIRGTDSMTVFRLKTSGWSDSLYRAHGAVRTVLGAGAR
jgi:peptidoglycan/xylan/chitin deacetylase (PgdA/CDA1 family)